MMTQKNLMTTVVVVVLFFFLYYFVIKPDDKKDDKKEEDDYSPETPAATAGGGNCSNPFSLAPGSSPGLQNNNPGNIRLTDIAWEGKVPNDCNTNGSFEQFYQKKYGIRAMIKNLSTYYYKRGAKTIRTIINRWSTTDKDAYIAFVSQKMNRAPDSILPFTKTSVGNLVKAIAQFENGTSDAVTQMEFEEAWYLLYKGTAAAPNPPTVGFVPSNTGNFNSFNYLRGLGGNVRSWFIPPA